MVHKSKLGRMHGDARPGDRYYYAPLPVKIKEGQSYIARRVLPAREDIPKTYVYDEVVVKEVNWNTNRITVEKVAKGNSPSWEAGEYTINRRSVIASADNWRHPKLYRNGLCIGVTANRDAIAFTNRGGSSVSS